MKREYTTLNKHQKLWVKKSKTLLNKSKALKKHRRNNHKTIVKPCKTM